MCEMKTNKWKICKPHNCFCNSDPRTIHGKDLQLCYILALIHEEAERPSPKLSLGSKEKQHRSKYGCSP
jgi:hypothetical protein